MTAFLTRMPQGSAGQVTRDPLTAIIEAELITSTTANVPASFGVPVATSSGTIRAIATPDTEASVTGFLVTSYPVQSSGNTFGVVAPTANTTGNRLRRGYFLSALKVTNAVAIFTETTSNNFLDGDTLTIGNQVYTMKTTLGSTPGNVARGASFAVAATNLVASIMGTTNTSQYVPTATPANFTAGAGSGYLAGKIMFQANAPGPNGNLLASTYAAFGTSAGSFGAATFAGGASLDGPVYMTKVVGGTLGLLYGDMSAVSDTSYSAAIPNARFMGYADANNIVEIAYNT